MPRALSVGEKADCEIRLNSADATTAITLLLLSSADGLTIPSSVSFQPRQLGLFIVVLKGSIVSADQLS